MSYGSNYYNYQIAVVFAILIVALLILGAFVLGIYYVFVVNSRNKKTSGRTRTPSSIPATRTNWQPAPPQQVQPQTTPYSPSDFQRTAPQDYNYDPRPSVQPGYIQQPLVQQSYGGAEYTTKIRELQPEYVYQQGPVTWTNTQQVHESAYPISPVQQIQGSASAGAYHMSSV